MGGAKQDEAPVGHIAAYLQQQQDELDDDGPSTHSPYNNM